MNQRFTPEKAPEVCDHTNGAQTFCDGLNSIEVDRHGNARLAFYVEQRCPWAPDQGVEHHVVERLVIPVHVLFAAMDTIDIATAGERHKARSLRSSQ